MYYPISDYALIGDASATALVSKHGSIDYCCMPAIDSPTVFATLLDGKKGGSFLLNPRQPYSSNQFYIENTAVVKTVFETIDGAAMVTDCFVMDKSGLHVIHRCVHCEYGRIPFIVQVSP